MTVDMELLLHYTKLIRDHGWPVFESLPPEQEEVNTPYPFVMIGEIDNNTGGDKSRLSGTMSLTIDVWGHLEDRPTVSAIANGILFASLGTWRTEHFSFTGYKNAQQVQLSTDTSTQNTVFCRATVNIELQIN